MVTNCLFIGGPADGQRRTIPEFKYTIEVTTFLPTGLKQDASVSHSYYYRAVPLMDDVEAAVYLYEKTDAYTAVRMLLDGYKNPD